jgi:general secretion pathway protein L
MKMLFKIAHNISSWIDAAAADFAALAVWLSAPKVIRLVEDESGGLVDETNNHSETLRASKHHVQMAEGLVGRGPVEAAAELSKTRVELVLRPDRFLFHPVELPAQAEEFLDGIVRAQLDRLTPWNAADAAFGWTKPIAAASGRIVVTVAAAPRTGIMPLLRPLLSSGARSIAVYTQAPGHEQSVG